jgi:ribosome-associated translation inhibitor RaiA
MQRPLKITSRDFSLDQAMETEIREKAAALDHYYDRISGCEVTVEAPALGHHQKGGPFNVRIHLTVPGGELVVNRHPEPDLTVAIHEAFHAARRELEDFARKQRGDVKNHQRQ